VSWLDTGTISLLSYMIKRWFIDMMVISFLALSRDLMRVGIIRRHSRINRFNVIRIPRDRCSVLLKCVNNECFVKRDALSAMHCLVNGIKFYVKIKTTTVQGSKLFHF
jgi:uncharacterized protein YlbG (UPF0298 family)